MKTTDLFRLVAIGLLPAALGLAFAAPARGQECPNAAIRAAQGPAVETLPDCMALEQVSQKNYSQNAHLATVSANGERILFHTGGAIGDPPGVLELFFGDPYVATRGSDGWGSFESALPLPDATGTLVEQWSLGGMSRSFDPTLSRWVGFGASKTHTDVGWARLYRGGLGGAFEYASPLLVATDRVHEESNVRAARFHGASADHSHLYFQSGDLSATYLPGDPVPAGTGADRNLYEATTAEGAPGLELVARDKEDKVWGGACGARVGGVESIFSRRQGAIAADGSLVLFSTRPGQTGSGPCDTGANKLRVLRRVEGPAGPEIAPLIASAGGECGRLAGDPGGLCDTTDGDDRFQGASVDGTKVFFTTTRQLADSDVDVGLAASPCSAFFAAAGCDLYLYDSTRPSGERLTQVSAGDAGSPTPGDGAGVLDGVAAISGDGSRVYFVAQGVLTSTPGPGGATPTAGQHNLYAYARDEDHPDGELSFVGTVASADGALGSRSLSGGPGDFSNGAYPVPITGTDEAGAEVGGSGDVLLFETTAALTPDDLDGGRRDLYRYDSRTRGLERISRALPGGSDNGAFDVYSLVGASFPDGVGTGFAESGRWVSEDGRTVVFQTAEPLDPADDNGMRDVYMRRDGQLYRMPGSADPAPPITVGTSRERNPVMSHDGSTVAFVAPTALLATDGDGAADIYVARIDGGFPAPKPKDACDPLAERSCATGGTGQVDAPVSTSSPTGGGNVTDEPRTRLRVAALSRKARLRASRSGVVRLRIRATAGGRVSLTARGRIGRKVSTVARRTIRLRPGRTATARLPLSRPAKRRLRSGRTLALAIIVRQSGARARTVRVLLPGVGS